MVSSSYYNFNMTVTTHFIDRDKNEQKRRVRAMAQSSKMRKALYEELGGFKFSKVYSRLAF